MIFYWYPRCTTCWEAKSWLDKNGFKYEERHIVDNTPTFEEIKMWYEMSKLPLKKFFNSYGTVYRDMGLKNKLPDMREDEQLELLASNGMLIKRPLVVEGDIVKVGFKEADWEATLLQA